MQPDHNKSGFRHRKACSEHRVHSQIQQRHPHWEVHHWKRRYGYGDWPPARQHCRGHRCDQELHALQGLVLGSIHKFLNRERGRGIILKIQVVAAIAACPAAGTSGTAAAGQRVARPII